MATDTQKKRQADKLAREILRLSSNMLHVRLRFLDLALSELRPSPVSGFSLGTDGKKLYYGIGYILREYKSGQDSIARELLHLLMHCVLRHMFVGPVDIALWNLACDMAVEDALLELDVFPPEEYSPARRAALESMASNVKIFTAEHIYRYLCEGPLGGDELEALSMLFRSDDHWPWYLPEGATVDGDGNVLWNISAQNMKWGTGQPDASWSERWQALGYRMQIDIETSSKQWGNASGYFLQKLERLNREKYDYTGFLKKFAVMGEAIKVNDGEFDQNFYTYGLDLYGNMPLVEPLEYKDVKRVREFVIAIDTSGSVAGDLVQKFVQKTYNILKTTESFFTKINLHIIQCDAAIQEDTKITAQEELDDYLKALTLRGFGGTDFRPVFEHVDKLVREGEFTNLKGIIYFTDGYGMFPEQKPPYEAAFVFVDQEQAPPMVPVWAIRLMLSTEELEDG